MASTPPLPGAGNELPPSITPFSDLGAPPEKLAVWRPLGTIYVAAMSAAAASALVALSPAILALTAIRRFVHRRPVYHTPPENIRVAIVGGGWSGLQCMARLKDLGVERVTGFERYDAIGGTWHPNLRYHSIQIHGAMWITSFSKYPYAANKDENDGKASGEATQNYCHRFASDKGLNENYQLNSKITRVKYDSAGRTAMLVVEDPEGRCREEGPFDLVIYTSQASEPNIPKIQGVETFKGKVLHSTQFKKEQFDEIIEKKAKVAVIGGSKAACDLVLCFQRSGYKVFNWIYRKPYLFWKYEAMFHNRSIVNALRGFSTIVGVLLVLVSKRLAGLMFWGSGQAVTHGKMHNDWGKFHFGILCPKQRRDLAAIPTEQRVIGNPKRYVEGGLEMDDGRIVEADYVLFGTGCGSGIDKIAFEKDGAPYTLGKTTRMLNYFFVPDFPVFANSTALWTTFGPVRAVNSADMAIYHLCVRARMTEEAMKKKAKQQLGGTSDPVQGFFFSTDTVALKVWLIMHLDLMFGGYVDFFDFLWHAIQVFCLSQQDALKFRILPEVKRLKQQ